MESKTNLPDVPYMVHEQDMTRLERTIKRLWVTTIILILSLLGTNAAWIYWESQWEYTQETTSVTQDVDTGNGDTNVTGIGDIYGTSETDGNKDN